MENEKMPLISIIVPIYNGERYLNECIDSILGQDYENIEVILVDDGSIDKSGEIIDNYKNIDNRVIVIHQKNSGVSVARNNALNNVHGKYVCLIDQDDYISKEYISYFYNLILKNNAEIAITPYPRKFIEITKNDKNEDEKMDNIEIWTGIKATREMLYYNVVISPWNKMFSSDLIKANNLKFDERYYGGEGFLFTLECFSKAKKIVVGHKRLYNYRCDNPNSGVTKFRMEVIDSSINAQKTIKKILLKIAPELELACKYANWHTYCDCYNTFIGCKVKNKYVKKCKEIKKVCQRDALCVIKAPIHIKEKIKGFMYFINPYIAAKLINHFRLRKFTVE